MKYILFLILLLAIVGLYIYYENRIALLRKQLMLTSNNYYKTKSQYSNLTKGSTINNIKFSIPLSKLGLTNNNTKVYLGPSNKLPVVKSLDIKMEVILLDKAELKNEIWYYVNLPIDSDINCRGWINQNDFSTIYSTTNDIIKLF